MIDADVRDQSPSSIAKPRRLRFSLLTLLIFVGVVGVVLGKWFYYRPLTVKVNCYFAVVDSDLADDVLSFVARHPIDASAYQWVVLNDEGLDALLNDEYLPATTWGKSKDVQEVSQWPKQRFRTIYMTFLRPGIGKVSGSFSGSFGSRLAGFHRQFRVDCDIDYGQVVDNGFLGTAFPTHPTWRPTDLGNQLDRKLLYDGPLSDSHLVFLAPFRSVYEVVIIDVK